MLLAFVESCKTTSNASEAFIQHRPLDWLLTSLPLRMRFHTDTTTQNLVIPERSFIEFGIVAANCPCRERRWRLCGLLLSAHCKLSCELRRHYMKNRQACKQLSFDHSTRRNDPKTQYFRFLELVDMKKQICLLSSIHPISCHPIPTTYRLGFDGAPYITPPLRFAALQLY